MSNEIVVKGDKSELSLHQSKKVLGITKKILSYDLAQDDYWMQRLWSWADENGFLNESLPRSREGLLNLTELNLSFCKLKDLPPEISYLKNLTTLDLSDNNFKVLPDVVTS